MRYVLDASHTVCDALAAPAGSFTVRPVEAGADPSVGSVGGALGNALAETTIGSFKNELIRRQGPWHDVDHVEIDTSNWESLITTR
jgi:putative transposase